MVNTWIQKTQNEFLKIKQDGVFNDHQIEILRMHKQQLKLC